MSSAPPGVGSSRSAPFCASRACQVAPRTYRSWRTNPVPARAVSDAAIIDRLRGLRTGGADGGPLPETLYGRRKMTGWLAGNGFPGVSKHTVDRLMRTEGMRGLVRGRKTRTTIAAKDGVRAGDLLNRNFRTSAPNRAWVTDFTYLATWSGFAYVAFALDLYSRAIVGWSAAMRKDVAFVEQCLSMALWRRDHAGRPIPEGMIHHSDAGTQYTSIRFTETLALQGLSASIGSVGDAYDNAVAESFMGLFKNEADRRRITVSHRPTAHPGRRRSRHHGLRRLVQPPPAAQPARPRHPRGVRTGLLRSPNRLTTRCRRQQEAGMKTGTVQHQPIAARIALLVHWCH